MRPIHLLLMVALAVSSASAVANPMLRSLAGQAWLNSPPLKEEQLRGKVILVDFGTYSCINWIRTLPWLRTWSDKYRQQGLVVVTVHTPEFDFERDVDRVRRALKAMRIEHAVVLDNDYAIWRSFGNVAWPALYIFDAHGRLRHHQSGEGGYERAETMIRMLLASAGANGVPEDVAPPIGLGVEVAADWMNLRTPEIYLGHERTANFASPGGTAAGERRNYVPPSRLSKNHWALAGEWSFHRQFAALGRPDGRVAVRFEGRDVHLVMGSSDPARPIRFQVLIDGQEPRGDHGLDVDERGFGLVAEPRLYQLVRLRSAADRMVEVRFFDAGVEAYSFTFG